jgi:hypothetical protein
MAANSVMNNELRTVTISGTLGGADNYEDIICKEITASESLLTPGLQTSATFQSKVYNNRIFKNWDATKNQVMFLDMRNKIGDEMKIAQTIYRLDNRELKINVGQIEEMTFHACDVTLLRDAKTLVSKSWSCTTPDQVVRYVLESCVGANNPDIQESSPGRDYIAEMIHPFQVVQQQANMALDGDDPSFVHFMTYGNRQNGWEARHHFKSLKQLANQTPKAIYYHTETGYAGGQGYNQGDVSFQRDKDGEKVIHFSFPCDYDLLSDLLNGLDENGRNINSGSFLNVSDATGSYLNGTMSGCIQNGNFKQSLTNKGTAQQQNGCETDVEKHLLRRQARMGLLEKDKIALRLIAPWNPELHAGDVIEFRLFDKQEGSQLLYGSGNYMISSMSHRIYLGGYATTTLDCVATTVGQGIV